MIEPAIARMRTTSATAHPARVLLVNLNRYDQPYPVYPLGLAHLNGALHAAGYETRIWDAIANGRTLEAEVAEFAPDLIGLSLRNIDTVQCLTPHSFVPDVIGCTRRLQALTRAPIVLGGSGFSIFPTELLEVTGADYGIAGEGEVAMVALLDALGNGRHCDDLPGLVYRRGGTMRSNPPARLAGAKVTSPRHPPELLRRYAAQGSLPGIQTQRGCPLRCCYCTYPLIEGRRTRFRAPEEIVADMRQMASAGVRYTFIVDSVFNTRESHVRAICEALIRADLGIEWECFLRPTEMSRELLELMKRAGLRHIEFGSDSFSDPVLKQYGKSFMFDDVRRASELSHALGLQYSHFLIVGGPGETAETLEETLDRAQTLPGAYYFATIGMRIYPDTQLWDRLAPEKRGETRADYLGEPRFYIAPGLTSQGLHERLTRLRRISPNWILGDPPPAVRVTIQKLRQRGLRGPLWDRIELMQRLESGAAESVRDAGVTAS